MGNVFVIRDDGRTEPMKRVRCANEDRELQLILEQNPNLLPGEQIDPDDPRRWLLIKREMPVPDPNNGVDRWSSDFVFADQEAMPTFVECKRYADTRSRREVVGQMFEYAANGHHYWSKDDLRSHAEQAAAKRGITLDQAVAALDPADGMSSDAYFERLQQNLREGQVRIVFFMEESSMELRSVVDFLNKQMERSEVLLVEARQFELDGARVVVPTLFGYTEAARQVKRSVTVSTAGSRRKWDEAAFFAEVRTKNPPAETAAVEAFFRRCIDIGFRVAWGTGKVDGSFGFRDADVAPTTLLNVFTNGTMNLNFGWLNGNPTLEGVRSRLKELIYEKTTLTVPDDFAARWISFPADVWTPQSGAIADALAVLVAECRGKAG